MFEKFSAGFRALVCYLVLSQVWGVLANPFLVARRPPPGGGKYKPHGHSRPKFTDSRITHQAGCNLNKPTTEEWKNSMNATLQPWIAYNWENYINSNYTTFPKYMAGEFAPETVGSSTICDGLGRCSIGSCTAIAKDISDEDRQCSYYIFEMLAMIDHVSDVVAQTTKETTDYMLHRGPELVKDFTFAHQLEALAKQQQKTEKILLSVGTALLLLATSLLGLGVAGPATTAAMVGASSSSAVTSTLVPLKAYTDLVANIYIGVAGVALNFHDDTNLVDKIEDLYLTVYNRMAHAANTQVPEVINALMEGNRSASNSTLVDLMSSGEFIEEVPGLRLGLGKLLERWYFATAVNGLWAIERAYILDTDVHPGTCHLDDRGPPRNRVCLPEQPNRAYYLYNIHNGEEGDTSQDDQAQVRAPPGLRKIDERPDVYYNITKQDIVRSSLWVHRQGLHDKIQKHELPLGPGSFTDKVQNSGSLPGAFTIPVCRNPGGEAISSVWHNKARNYPCMCGEFGWREGQGWTPETDQTWNFLWRTGFYASEDWEDYCSDHNHCHGENSMGIDFPIKEGMPKKTKKLRHPFKYCKEPKRHETHGNPHHDV